MDRIQQLIVNVANSYLGQQEIRGNRGFIDEVFEEKMRTVGWEVGQAWCAYFAELVWKEAYAHHDAFMLDVLDKLFNASAVKTFRLFEKDERFEILDKPVPGALAVWQKYVDGKPDWRGHIGVCTTELQPDETFLCMEGNTNSAGGREGIEVAHKKNTMGDRGSLKPIGFVKPVD